MTEQTQQAASNEGINLQDLAGMIQIIDVCTKRGAFEGSELAMVGGLRNKVEAFVKAAAEQNGQAAPEAPAVMNEAQPEAQPETAEEAAE